MNRITHYRRMIGLLCGLVLAGLPLSTGALAVVSPAPISTDSEEKASEESVAALNRRQVSRRTPPPILTEVRPIPRQLEPANLCSKSATNDPFLASERARFNGIGAPLRC